MRTVLSYSLASVLLMAAARDAGSGGNNADAKKEADDAAVKEAAAGAAAEKERLEAESKRAEDEARSTAAAALDERERMLGERELANDERERKIDRVLAFFEAQQGAGAVGGAEAGQAKASIISAPGGAQDRLSVQTVPGRTTGPTGQPHPALSSFISPGQKNPYDFEDDEVTVWGRRADGTVIRPRAYPELTEQRVLVTKTIYHNDRIFNEGEIIEDYTGPLGGGLRPIRDDGSLIPLTDFKRAA